MSRLGHGLRGVLPLVFIFFCSCTSTVRPVSLMGAEYAALDGMLLSPKVTVAPVGQVRTELWGEVASASAYDLSAPVSVQTAGNGTTSATFATAIAKYQVRVTP